MYIGGAVEGHIMSAVRKECENKDNISNLYPHGVFLKGMHGETVSKRALFWDFKLVGFFCKMLRKYHGQTGRLRF